jgi:uncharacterized protein CbrC (UPF0167 family)
VADLPTFRYHPDPIATGSVVASETRCRCCRRASGYVYTGPVYAEEELDGEICPWCIADGRAHERFDAEFTDSAGVGGGSWPEAPAAVVEEVAYRTPGFQGWQQEQWAVCCGDAAAFVGRAGRVELETRYPDAIADVRRDAAMSDADWDAWYAQLDAEAAPTAYVFRCLLCGRHTGYSDCH